MMSGQSPGAGLAQVVTAGFSRTPGRAKRVVGLLAEIAKTLLGEEES